MEQTVNENENTLSNIKEAFANKYSESPSFKEYIFLGMPEDFKVDHLIEKTRANVDKFLIYHIGLAVVIYTIFLLFNLHFIFCFGLIILTIYLVNIPTKIQGYEITPLFAILGCVGINFIVSLLSENIRQEHVMFFTVTCFIIVLVVIHSILNQTRDSENIDNDGDKI
ncbi:hypothetical protein A0H76_2829 [Hepatospora eriocheir]|uniref:PRA1 family protein n=1 Tax=Hepatospora eriocheir TaxID=1081669 RepID=A0A1X0QLB4_9MICR|nr:hypothetical protein A0H76_2829 [Hepatospora eriocheir]